MSENRAGPFLRTAPRIARRPMAGGDTGSRSRRQEASCAGALDAFARDLNVVLARGVRRVFAIAEDQFQTCARRALGAGLYGRPRTCARTAAPDGRVRAEPVPARVALSPRPRGRIPGHEPSAVGTGFSARSGPGERASVWWRTTRPCGRPSSSSGTGSSRFTGSATPRWRSWTRQRGTSKASVRIGDARRSITTSYRALPELLAFVNEVFAAVIRRPERSDAFRYDERDRFPIVDALSRLRA